MHPDRSAPRPERIGREAAALILGVPGRTVTLLARRGEIPSAAKIGRTWTFNEERLRAWIRAKEEDGAAAGLSMARYAATSRPQAPHRTARQQDVDRAYEEVMAGLCQGRKSRA